jgi:hypothetical protein
MTPSIESLKQQAKRLRAGLAEDGGFISHSESLELIARQYGFRDWNTLHAAAGNRPAITRFQLGTRVKGRYLGQAFTGEIVALQAMPPDHLRVSLHFDEPVDVVKFDSFSAYRQRVSALINRDGVSAEKTSDGAPQLELKVL